MLGFGSWYFLSSLGWIVSGAFSTALMSCRIVTYYSWETGGSLLVERDASELDLEWEANSFFLSEFLMLPYKFSIDSFTSLISFWIWSISSDAFEELWPKLCLLRCLAEKRWCFYYEVWAFGWVVRTVGGRWAFFLFWTVSVLKSCALFLFSEALGWSMVSRTSLSVLLEWSVGSFGFKS